MQQCWHNKIALIVQCIRLKRYLQVGWGQYEQSQYSEVSVSVEDLNNNPVAIPFSSFISNKVVSSAPALQSYFITCHWVNLQFSNAEVEPRETEKTSKILKLTPFFAVLLMHIDSCGILSVLCKWQGENRISLKRGSYKLDQEFLLYNASESERASFKLAILIGTENWFNLSCWKWYYQFLYESHFPYLWRISFSATHICFLLIFSCISSSITFQNQHYIIYSSFL